MGLQPTFYLRPNFRAELPRKARLAAWTGSRRDWGSMAAMGTMAVKLDEIRSAAARVAASHGLDVVDMEFIGPAKERTLRVYLEKNAEGRAQAEGGDRSRQRGNGAFRNG